MNIAQIHTILSQVTDPEIPVLTIQDLGIIRKVEMKETGDVEVVITPTYLGCPAMDTIAADIKNILHANGIQKVQVTTVLSPAWTTDWLSENGKQKLEAYGIAPPLEDSADKLVLTGQIRQVVCPQCKSQNTHMISQFGSTACKALFRCEDCLEPFDYFKCLR